MIVLDASALVDLCVLGPTSGWVADRFHDELVCAPAHQPSEVLSALARMLRAEVLDLAGAREALEDAMSADQDIVPIHAAHLRRAFELRDRLRVVDGLYVALAEERRCPLVTTDLRLARSVTTCEVLAPTA